MTEMLNELDNDIEITSENIVNPGKKKKEPLGEVIEEYSPCSTFLSCHLVIVSFHYHIIIHCFRFSTSS